MQISGLRKWIQQRVSGPLLLALCLSMGLHVFFFSEVDWQHWFIYPETPPVLQARLLSPPVPPPVKAVAQRQVKPKPVKHTATPGQITPPPPAATQPLAAPEAETTVAPTTLPDTTDTPTEGQDEQQRLAEIEAWHEMAPPEAESDAPVPPPYQHVNTEYVVYVNGEDRPAGSATIEYIQEATDKYRLRWQVEGRGLLKLLYPSLEQQSQGEIGPHGLKPQFYRYAFGSRANKTYEASFDWETSFITLRTAKGEQRQDLRANTQDILSFMYQFMFVPPLQEMHVTLTNGRRVGEYEYAFEGEDSMEIAGQAMRTVHIVHTRGDTDEKVELWLASDYRYVPVKIKKLEKNGMVIEQVATRLIAE